jgi:hypothetical protein
MIKPPVVLRFWTINDGAFPNVEVVSVPALPSIARRIDSVEPVFITCRSLVL